ncbi:MAG: GntR family transcriptional regulator [Lachnospiraceae bacterium]|nr:GntR family transcriptional regulator [Lachnospiraceae bacterium]MBQ9936508.1 GntR family transcriptional regulator [Lachnospiraceae bacterium]
MIRLDLKRDTPIYEQIVEQVKYHVVKGNIKPGMAIPSVRKLALELNITPGTVAKAYQELERQGIVETIRGKGVYIAGESDRKPDSAKLEAVKKSLEPGLLELKVMGLDEQEVLALVKELYGKLSN